MRKCFSTTSFEMLNLTFYHCMGQL